jgi:hypothetical protein
MISEFRFDPARAHEAPAAKGFKNGEQSRRHQNQSPQRIITGDNNPGDKANRPDDAARDASVAVKVGFEEPAHGENLPRRA